jgi:protein-tyrosine-phosphatase
MTILFICEGNINRSQMAGAFFKALRPEAVVLTAGTLVAPEVEGKLLTEDGHYRAQEVMRELGYSLLPDARMRRATKEMVESADAVVMIAPTPGGPIPAFITDSPKTIVWQVPDPGYQQASHAEARDFVQKKVIEFVASVS